MKRNGISIAEIARIANVHPSTVSRALSDNKLIKEETRLQIQKIAREHGYVPDAVAKSLIQGRTMAIGVIVPETANSFFAHILDGLDEVLEKNGYNLIICTTRYDRKKQENTLRTLVGRRVDGLVICSMYKDPEVQTWLYQLSKTLPLVLCDNTSTEHLDRIMVDNEAGLDIMADHILSRGYSEIGCIADEPTAGRLSQFVSVLQRRGIHVRQEHRFISEKRNISAGYDAIYAMMEQGTLPRALFACRDTVAIGAMRAAHELNIGIPEQLAVSGYDGIMEAEYLYKKLTTVRQPSKEIGRNAAQLLLRKLSQEENPDRYTTVNLQPKLIIGETT